MARVIITGTGYRNADGSDRASIIRKNCKKGAQVTLRREPDNKYDPNAIAVYIEASSMFGLISSEKQIGYIKHGRSGSLAKRMDSGEKLSAKVSSFSAPAWKGHPRVSLEVG